MRTLKKGCRGEDVRYLQYLLRVDADGRLGPKTEFAVKAFQEYNGLEADGIVGPATRALLRLDDYHVHIFDLKKHSLWCVGCPYGSAVYFTRTLKEWAGIEDADITFNLAFFNTKGRGRDGYGTIKGRTLTYVKAQGRDVGYGGTSEIIKLNDANAFAGYKLAIKDGKKQPVSRTGKRARNATGLLKDGRFFIAQTVTTSTEDAMVDYMLGNYQVDLMMFQDGGGSVGMYDARYDVLIAGEREGANGRPVATAICVKLKRG